MPDEALHFGLQKRSLLRLKCGGPAWLVTPPCHVLEILSRDCHSEGPLPPDQGSSAVSAACYTRLVSKYRSKRLITCCLCWTTLDCSSLGRTWLVYYRPWPLPWFSISDFGITFLNSEAATHMRTHSVRSVMGDLKVNIH